jgi:hypothetical protein
MGGSRKRRIWKTNQLTFELHAALKSDEQKQRLAQQSEFDISKEKQLASAKAADAYRRSAAAEDPFRAAARVG